MQEHRKAEMDIYEIIGHIGPLPEDSLRRLAGELTEVSCAKGDRILETGKTERNIFFVARGIVRAFLPIDGRDITFWIGTEGATVVSLKSYVLGASGYETVECVEPTLLYALNQNVLTDLYQQDIHIANWGRKFAETELLQTEERFIPLLFTTAAQRYRALLEKQPHLLQRIPLEHLASYLGITPVSLSRIRAQILK